MKALVIYDSMYGNTGEIARSIGDAIDGEVQVLQVGTANPSDIESIDLLIIGSPTQGGRPTPAVQNFINGIEKDAVKGVPVAAFDTRVSAKWVGIFGYAAGRIANSLKKKGGILAAPPEAFFVIGKEGPLKERIHAVLDAYLGD